LLRNEWTELKGSEYGRWCLELNSTVLATLGIESGLKKMEIVGSKYS